MIFSKVELTAFTLVLVGIICVLSIVLLFVSGGNEIVHTALDMCITTIDNRLVPLEEWAHPGT